MTTKLAMHQEEAPGLKPSEPLHDDDVSDTSSTSCDEDLEELSQSESEANDSEYEHSEYSIEDEDSEECMDDSSSWNDDHGGLEEELMRFTLSRASSCSKLGGGFPSLEQRGNQIPAAKVPRRSSSARFAGLKELLVSEGLQEDDGVAREDSEDGSEIDVSESESEGLEDQLEQLKSSVHSMYSMKGLTKPPMAAAPKLDGELGLIDKDDENLKLFVQTKPGQPLAIVQTDSHQTTKSSLAMDMPKPAAVLRSILKYDTRDSFPAEMWEGYFLDVKNNHIRAHTKEMELTVRCEDFGKLRSMIRSGQTLQSCNQHGESIVHLACRRSSVKLLKFLIDEAQVTVRVRDDYGRSPLHDTCWSYNDRFDIFKTLLEESPELLFVEDKRGCSPFDYIPKKRWEEWNQFLEANADFLRRAINVVDLKDMDVHYRKTH